MKFSNEHIYAFLVEFREVFGKEVQRGDVEEIASNLVQFTKTVLGDG